VKWEKRGGEKFIAEIKKTLNTASRKADSLRKGLMQVGVMINEGAVQN